MRIIANKPYDSIFVYFQGIENPTSWTLESPAVFEKVSKHDDEGGAYVDVDFSGTEKISKYLLFKVLGGVEYVLYSDSCLKICLYSYLYHNDGDVMVGENYLESGTIGPCFDIYSKTDTSSSMTIKFKNSIVLLAKIDSMDKNDNPKIYFSNYPVKFNYYSRYVRDWSNRVEGTSWEISGKVPVFCSLSDISRNYIPLIGHVEGLKNGIKCELRESSEVFYSLEECEKFFSNNDNNAVLENIFPETFHVSELFGIKEKCIVKFDFLYFSFEKEKKDTLFKILSHGGECHVKMNGYYGGIDSSGQFSTEISPGMNKITVYYCTGENSIDFYFQYYDYYYGYYYDIEKKNMFIENCQDINIHLDLEKILGKMESRSFYPDDFFYFSNGTHKIDCGKLSSDNKDNNLSFSFWFKDSLERNESDNFKGYNIVKYGGFLLKRSSLDSVEIYYNDNFVCRYDKVDFSYYHHFCFCIGFNFISWYFDMTENSQKIFPDKIIHSEEILLGDQEESVLNASGSMIFDFILFKEIITQIEVNKLNIYSGKILK